MTSPVLAAPAASSATSGRSTGRLRPGHVGVAALVGILAGVLAAAGAGFVVLGVVLGLPLVVLVHRQPIAVLTIWLVMAPLVSVTDQMSVRMVFWLIHRLMPLAALVLVVVVRPLLYDRVRPLGRLGGPDLLAIGYVAASIASILTQASQPAATMVLFHDRVIAPVGLYLLVRLLRPDRATLERWILPGVVVMLTIQLALGLLAWTVPGALPSAWTSELGQRTTGSLQAVSVYGATIIFGSLVMLHRASTAARSPRRTLALLLFGLGTCMVFLTFSRGSWLAGTIAIGGGLLLHRRMVGRATLVAAATVLALAGSGFMSGQLQYAEQRVSSQHAEVSALSRLPVAVASVRMFEERPLTGWGYEQFNRYDRAFQGPVAGFYPSKDHSSHNVYLLLLAEQGLIGFVLFVGPAVWWLARTRRLRRSGLLRGEPAAWAAILWLSLAAHVVVNNFSNMKGTVGLGLWWLTLALIATTVEAAERRRPVPRKSRT